MKRAYQIIAIVAIVTIVCVLAYVVTHTDDKTLKGTYSYGYESFQAYEGKLVSDDGSTISLDDISDKSVLVTLWKDGAPIHYDNSVKYAWYEFYVDFYCDPGITISAQDIHIMEGYLLNDDRYSTVDIEYDGRVYHHEDSDMTVTIGPDGHGRWNAVLILSDYSLRDPAFTTSGIEWTLLTNST